MKIGELFEIKRGNCSGLDTYAKGSIPFVSAGTINGGVACFVSTIPGGRLFKDLPCLSVAANGDGGMAFASIKNAEFYATSDVAVLTPKWQHLFWQSDIQGKLIAVAAYIRKQRWRFGFGRKMTTRFADLDVDMSVIQSIFGAIVNTKLKIRTITEADVVSLLARLPNGVAIQDLFEVAKKKSLPAEGVRDVGTTPLVSTTERNNGVSGFVNTIDADYLVPSGGISVAKNGRPMVSRIQMDEYVKTGDMAPLVAKSGVSFTERELAILAALIENQGWRYHYLRKANWDRMGPQVIT